MSHWHRATSKALLSAFYLCIVNSCTFFIQYKGTPCVETSVSVHRQYVCPYLHLRPSISNWTIFRIFMKFHSALLCKWLSHRVILVKIGLSDVVLYSIHLNTFLPVLSTCNVRIGRNYAQGLHFKNDVCSRSSTAEKTSNVTHALWFM